MVMARSLRAGAEAVMAIIDLCFGVGTPITGLPLPPEKVDLYIGLYRRFMGCCSPWPCESTRTEGGEAPVFVCPGLRRRRWSALSVSILIICSCIPEEQEPQEVLGWQVALPGQSLVATGDPRIGEIVASPSEGDPQESEATGAADEPPAAELTQEASENELDGTSPSQIASTAGPSPAITPPAVGPNGASGEGGGPLVPRVAPTTAVGLSPRTHDAAGYLEAIDRVAQAAEVGLVQGRFAWDFLNGRTDGETYRANYDWMVLPDGQGESVLGRSGLRSAWWLSFTDAVEPERVSAGLRFSDPQVAAAFVAECAWFAGHFEPDYLALGVEVESYLAAADQQERDAFLQAFISAREACHAARPGCVVFMYFQYENVRARDLWELIAPFARAGDAFGFSSYPSSPIAGGGVGIAAVDLGESYFEDMAVRLGGDRPLIIAEFGHPSAASQMCPWGTPQEQADMVSQLFRSLARRNTALVCWTYLHDSDLSSVYDPDLADYFGSMGLLRSSQSEPGGPAWDAWLAR